MSQSLSGTRSSADFAQKAIQGGFSPRDTATTPMPHFSAEEHSRLKALQEKGKQPAEIARLMGRDLSNVYRHFQRNLQGGQAPNPAGRPPALTAAQVDKVVETTEAMVVAADGKYQVTAKMVKDALVSVRCCGSPILLCSAMLLPFGRRRSPSRSLFPAPQVPDRLVLSRSPDRPGRGRRPISSRSSGGAPRL